MLRVGLCVLPGQGGVLLDERPLQALGQTQRLLFAPPDVVEGLGEEDHGGVAGGGLPDEGGAGREVLLLVGGGSHLTDGDQRIVGGAPRHCPET